MKRDCVVLSTVFVLLIAGCATPNQEKLNKFSTLTLNDSSVHETDTLRVEAVRVGADCLKEMFRTSKVNKQFTVCWLSVHAKGEKTIEFDRNRIALSLGNTNNYPVGPGRVAYLSKSSSTAMLIAAVAIPVLAPIGAPIAVSGGTAYYAAVNVTGVAASAHVAGTEGSNTKRTQGTRLGSLPDTAVIQPGETLAGFVFFEVPAAKSDILKIEGEFLVGEGTMPFCVTNLPEVNPEFGKENENEEKN